MTSNTTDTDARTDYVNDDTIEDAIDQHGDPDHSDEPTVKEVRDLLALVDTATREGWATYMDQIEDGTYELVADTDDLLILSTGEVAMYGEELKHAPVDVDERALDVVGAVMHAVAGELTDYDWGVSYPLVVRKPESFDAGQRYVEAVVNGLQARGLSPGQAWAYYGVEIRDNSQRSWGFRKGDYDNKNVGDALETAREKLPELPAF